MNIAPAQTASRLHGLSQQAVRYVVEIARELDLGRADQAERHIVGLMALYPDHPEVLRLFAGLQNLRGRRDDAISSLRRAIALRPGDALYYNTLGATLIDAGQYDQAIDSLRHACELDPTLSNAWYNLGLALMRSMRVDESADALRRAIALSPDQHHARVILGEMLRASGHVDEAAAEYRRVHERQPYSGMAWWGLADIKTVKLGDHDIATIRRALAHPAASDDDKIAMGFALAKALDDQGQYARSLDALREANAIARKRQQWNAAEFSAYIDSINRAFTNNRKTAADTLGAEVIFIVSLPRSGSTLIEQVLASHSQVEGAGELQDLPMVFAEESQRRRQPFPQWATAMQSQDWERLGRRYLERTAHWRQRRPRFTDKLPSNWFYIGAIRAMLPAARIVCVRRDALETCFSCYRQHLANNEYTRTFSDLAAYWREFDRSVSHWHRESPDRVLQLNYERLVSAPEDTIREVLDFCGLPFESACLEFHRNERDVHTPSAMQVREPLRRDTARTQRYGDLLDSLRGALGMPPFAAAASR